MVYTRLQAGQQSYFNMDPPPAYPFSPEHMNISIFSKTLGSSLSDMSPVELESGYLGESIATHSPICEKMPAGENVGRRCL